MSVTANGRTVDARTNNGHIVIPPSRLVAGTNTIRFEFVAGEEALNRQDEFLYSLFVPARASLTFPCFDQPDLKARWRLSLDVPPGWIAVSNGRETGSDANGPDRVRYVFDETAPISTYLFAFAAGRFYVETAQRDGRTFRLLHRESDPVRVARSRDAIFDLHARAMSWLESYTDVAYPFGKFDAVLLPSFQFSGMEHPGAVFYNASALFLDASATQNQELTRANVISHEVAHMWFGNLTTMTWFNDVWMKEVFANFLAAKIVNPSFPEMNHDLRFLVQHYPAAYDVDRTDGSNPIRQDLGNLADAGSLYGAIIYQKAPIVMRQLEMLVGATVFRDGLREYLTLHGFANATWPDLVEILDVRTPHDLAAWSRVWVTEPGRPTITTNLEVADGAITRLTISQRDPRGRALTWTQQLQVLVGRGDEVRSFAVTTEGADAAVPNAIGLPDPDWVLPVGGGLGYGDFVLDEKTTAFLLRAAHTVRDPLTRAAAFLALWDSMLDGRVGRTALRDLLLTSLPVETNELTRQLLLDETRTLFWRFTPADARTQLASRVEPILRSGLARAKTTSEKAAWFSALRSIALTPDTLAWLEDVWARRKTIAGLPLAEADESDLALDLAVRDVPSAQAILTTQLERITNSDRKARFVFVMPALSRSPAARAAFFETLREPSNRAREAWVLDAVRYLHHPLRAEASEPFVVPALELVREIHRTGDIFFPKRWADATLVGYQSAATAEAVRAFIESLPADYPPRLRWVLLASADPLFRAARLSAQ